jgi:septal ring factor EnvC (AmiA/AmiB activator)
MAKKQKEQPKQTITIADKEHKVSDLTTEQVALVNHVQDLDRKIGSSQFNLDQLNVGRSAFMNLLTENLARE